MQDRNVLASKLKLRQLILRKIIKTVANRCHISKTKMHQIRFRLGLRPKTHWGAYSAPPDSLAGFKSPTSKGGTGKGKGGSPVFSVEFVGNPTSVV